MRGKLAKKFRGMIFGRPLQWNEEKKQEQRRLGYRRVKRNYMKIRGTNETKSSNNKS